MVLFYYGARNFFDEVIDFGEHIEDGPAKHYFYHLAVAENSTNKMEALSNGVQEDVIDYSRQFLLVNPPVDPARKSTALHRLRSLIGQQYDWWVIVDDALRILSKALFGRPVVHLPARFVKSQERHEKICVSLLRKYLNWAGSSIRIPYYATVEDAYNMLVDAGATVEG